MKTLIIGLDGATFTVLNPLLKAGYMPHLRQALERSATATLLSTIPPVTALAWPSFMTGKNPGRHGLLGWQGPLNAHFDRPWISGQAVRGVKLWQWANRAGLSAVVVNVPVTYPPQPLDGAMVTGMLTPGLTAGFTFPPQLKRDLLAAVPGYTIDVDIQHTERNLQTPDAAARFLNQNMALARARGAAARWLLERYRPDLGVVVFGLTDRLQHFFWRPITRLAAAGADDGTVSATLLACFQTLDDEIGQLLAGLPQTAHLIFLSDHGFGPLNTLVHLNHWLAERGWLAFSRGRSGGREALRRAGRLVRRWLPATVMRRARQNFSVLRTLDWGRTVAYAGLPSEYGIFLNLQGREPAGIVAPDGYDSLRAEIIAALQAWRNPHTGRPVMKMVYRREEIYNGEFVAQAPDIVFEFAPGYKVSHLPFAGTILTDVSDRPDGFHEREGIFAVSGPGVKPGAAEQPAIIEDVMPTTLYALGLPVPDDLDGRVLGACFTAERLARQPVQFQPGGDSGAAGPAAAAYSGREETLIEDRLRGLGYLE